MPTLELRECAWRLERVDAAVGPLQELDLSQELATFLDEMPYKTNYLNDPYRNEVASDIWWSTRGSQDVFRRSRTRLHTHIGLGALDYSCLLVLTERQARQLLDFEARAGLTGATPSLARLARRLAKEPAAAPRSD
jgi:hypothetical protein